MNRALLLISTLLTTPLHAAPSAWLKSETAGMHKITGPFVQTDYGFSVESPPDASEYVTNGGDANHGVRMILGERRKIDVYPEYTDGEWGNTEPCRRNQFPWEKTSSRAAGTVLLGTQTACLVTFTGRNTAWSVVQATGRDRGQGIMYTLLLTTTRQALQTDLASLHQVASTFKRIPIYP
jgi:hypothetical protein